MPPTQNERPQDVSSESELFSIPNIPSPVDFTSLSTTVSEFSTEPPTSPILYEIIEIPREPTLKELVQRASGLDDISEVTRVKLQVIAVDVSLQHLSYHTPLLRELVLDGSVVSSLRDLGCGLKCLKILRVSRCGLKHLDGTFGLESLEELYATKNSIKDISSCSNLPNIKVIDVQKNCITDITALTFLSLCPVLEHINLDENEDIVTYPKYRQTVKSLIPNLKTLDGQPFTEDECSGIINTVKEREKYIQEFPSPSPPTPKKDRLLPPIRAIPSQSTTSEGTYMVKFAPKVLSPRRQSSTSESPRDIQVNKVLPQISQVRGSIRKSSDSDSSS